MVVNYFDTRVFKIENYKHLSEDVGTPEEIILDSLAVLMDVEISYNRKKAAHLLLKALLRHDFLKYLLKEETSELIPYSRNDPRVKERRERVLAKANYKCERCGAKEELEAHHILYWSEYPKGRLDVNNGMCLCIDCHVFYHMGESASGLISGKSRRYNGKTK